MTRNEIIARNDQIKRDSTRNDKKFKDDVFGKSFADIFNSEYYKVYLLPQIETCLMTAGHGGNNFSHKFKKEFRDIMESPKKDIVINRDIDLYNDMCDCCGTEKKISVEWMVNNNTFRFGSTCEPRLKSIALVYDTIWRSSNAKCGYTCFDKRIQPSLDMWENMKHAIKGMIQKHSDPKNEPESSNDSDDDDDEEEDTDDDKNSEDSFFVNDLDSNYDEKNDEEDYIEETDEEEEEEEHIEKPKSKTVKKNNVKKSKRVIVYDEDDDEEEEDNLSKTTIRKKNNERIKQILKRVLGLDSDDSFEVTEEDDEVFNPKRKILKWTIQDDNE